MPLAQISLTLSHHFSLSFIASDRSSGLHSVSSHSCWMYVRAGRPAFARPYVGVHKSTSHMRSSLLLQQCPACLVRLTRTIQVRRTRYIYIYIYIYILPYPCRAEFSGEWSNRVAISVYCKSLHIWIEVSVAVKRMYINNSNCDS